MDDVADVVFEVPAAENFGIRLGSCAGSIGEGDEGQEFAARLVVFRSTGDRKNFGGPDFS